MNAPTRSTPTTSVLCQFGLTPGISIVSIVVESVAHVVSPFIEKGPNIGGYNNRGSVQRDKRDLTGAIDTLRGSDLPHARSPMLGYSLDNRACRGRRATRASSSIARRSGLESKLPRTAQSRLCTTRIWANWIKRWKPMMGAALAPNANEKRERRHSRTEICLIGMGRLREGFKEYEIRHDAESGPGLLHSTKGPLGPVKIEGQAHHHRRRAGRRGTS